MCDPISGEPTSGHEELWATSILPPDQGPEGNVAMWREAESYLEHLAHMSDHQDNEAVTVALTDAYNRAIEERRRAEDLLKLRARWSERRIGGVTEPEPVIVPKGGTD